jgi:hypothetical protein
MHGSLKKSCAFFRSLLRLPAPQPDVVSVADLVRAAVAAEEISNQEPWGLERPTCTVEEDEIYYAETEAS